MWVLPSLPNALDKTKNKMERTPVSSSNIRSIGYESDTSTLEIEFHKSGVYQYHGVPQEVYDALMQAGSHGTYFNSYIKNSYATTKL